MANVEGSPKSSRDWGIITKKDKAGNRQWYPRITRCDGSGKKKQYVARAENKSHARRLRDDLDEKYSRRGQQAINGDKLTFRKLSSLYEKRKLFPAEYHSSNGGTHKVAGFRSVKPLLSYLRVLNAHFGSARLKEITHSDIEDFKTKRVRTVSKRGERSIADVNRSLALLRSILRFAAQNGWIQQSPFEHGAPLISAADETKRERTLSFDEEKRVLTTCVDDRRVTYTRAGKEVTARIKSGRQILKALIISALDTAMRKGELLKLQWDNVDFVRGIITVIALNSKTAKARDIGMTGRVRGELSRLWDLSLKDSEQLVFGISDFKGSFAAACREAKVTNLRFHDLRHTAITRMVNAGLPPMEIMKVSGHTQWTTFARYVNPTSDSIRNIASSLDLYITNAQLETTGESEAVH